ncbi:MAG TPA: NHL repeat-containing protein [Thermoanaerobaculia bacterium]|nr:NHL repeat-containing protein [Thermoanaerobaculia bacterium]
MFRENLVLVTIAIAGAFATPAAAQSLSVTSLAGSTNGGGHVDSIGLTARFSLPQGLVVDAGGTLYLADPGNHVIRRITPDGQVTTVAGKSGEIGSADGVGENARFNTPRGITLGANNTLYVVDTDNHAIRSVSPTGMVRTFAGLAGTAGTTDSVGGAARFTFPRGIAADSSGNLYVADTSNHTVRKITSNATVTTLAGTNRSSGSSDGFGSQARFNFPFDVAVDAAGFVYVADTNNHTIRKITPEGRVTTVAGVSPTPQGDNSGSVDGIGAEARFEFPWGIDVDAPGNMYISDTGNNTVRKITPAAVVTTIAGSPEFSGSLDASAGAARFSSPRGIALDPSGNLFVSDGNNHAIRRITPSQVVTTFVGSVPVRGISNGQGTNARFFYPEGVATDAAGNIYVADLNHSIRKVTAGGAVTTFAGSPGNPGSTDGIGSAALIRSPYGVAVDRSGSVFVADTGNHTIRKIAPSGVMTTLAGVAGSPGDADGSGSQARFDSPFDVATDAFGNVYVADTYNFKIRMIEPSGVVTTFAGSGARGSRDAIGTGASFDYVTGIAIDDARNIYVADWANHTIRKITQSGTVSTLAGKADEAGSIDGVGSGARFRFPDSVASLGDGTLFVTDTENHTIRRVSPAGTVTTIAGLPGSAGNVNGTGRFSRFFFPEGIAVDGSGRVVIADTYNHAIRVGALAPPSIAVFNASPSSIRPGQSAQLSWSATNATSATIDHGIGAVSPSGNRVVTLQETTTFTLTVFGDGGATSASVTVNVGQGGRRRVARP